VLLSIEEKRIDSARARSKDVVDINIKLKLQ